ncbi:MAG: HAMP domain-containing sensor histidine kinase, partial [Ilumatobacteraceae bacterium]
VAALGALSAVGLLAFGLVAYSRYSSAEHRRLDDRLRDSASSAELELHDVIGLSPSDVGDPNRAGGRSLGIGSYAELRDGGGTVLGHLPNDTSGGAPALPTVIGRLDHPFTVGSVTGSGDWRASATVDSQFPNLTILVATPLDDVAAALRGLVLIEAIAAAALLALLMAGSWLILRRGLRPLETTAAAAGSIKGGDLSARVSPGNDSGEVGQLGLALDSMLDNLQESFAAQKESEAELRRFLADTSDELRTPLTSVQGFAERFRVAVEREHIDSDLIMHRIGEASQRMRELVDDLLLMARLDERRDIEPTDVDLAVLAADACSDAGAVQPDRPITLDAPRPVIVSGVPDQLAQAIAKLIANALAYTPPGTPIEVSTLAIAHRALVIVRDHGDGLGDEALAHSFDRFWRADASGVGPKAGLGLSIVQAIAESNGGVVSADNHPTGGAVFTIDLPLAPYLPPPQVLARPTEA